MGARSPAGIALASLALGAAAGACSRPPEAIKVPGADEQCLRALHSQGVAFRRLPAEGVMRTPVEIVAPLGHTTLVPGAGRAPVMDCALAIALAQVRRTFDDLGIRSMSFSGAYDYRTRRHSEDLSAHAFGLAIDVHSISGPFGRYVVAQQYEPGVGSWRGIKQHPVPLATCVGWPRTMPGRVLRTLACRLKLHPAFRAIVSPDDDDDHRDHLHIEAAANFYDPHLQPAPAPTSPPPDAGAAGRPSEVAHATTPRKKAADRGRAAKKKGAEVSRASH